MLRLPHPPVFTAPLASRSPGTISAICLAVATLAIFAVPLGAQERQGTSDVTVSGQVVDAVSGQPLPTALVKITDTRQSVVADADGRFEIRGLKPGRYGVVVSQLGYESRIELWEVGRENTRFDVAMQPQPLVLEGVRVQTDRLKRRRNAAATSVRLFERDQLIGAGYRDAADFVLTRGGISRAACPDRLVFSSVYAGSSACVRVRGRVQPVSVVIDEAPAFGLEQLAMYRPEELFLIEVYGGGRHIRAYTTWFMERMAKNKFPPIPLFF